MNVLLTAASFSPKISGVQRHAFNVVRCLLQHSEVSTVHLVVAPWQQELVRIAGLTTEPRLTVHFAEMTPSSLSRNIWYYQRLPHLAARLRPDLIHLSYPVPVNAAVLDCPTVVTLHDLYPYEIPSNFRFPNVLFNRLVLWECLRNVDAIACVSDTTLLRMKQYTSRQVSRKAIRIYNCVEPEPLRSEHSPLPDWRGEPFLLCVAQHRRNKNILLLIQVFHRLLRQKQINSAMKLVIIGIPGPETSRIHKLIDSCGLSLRVLLLSGLSEAELQWSYANCEALVIPSTTEGFGLPVVEGLITGCRVICSDIPALREIGEEHCRFVRLGKGEAERLAREIVTSLQESPKPPIAFPRLSVEVLANEYINLYRRLISMNTLRPTTEDAVSLLGITQGAVAMTNSSPSASQHRRDEHGRI